MVQQKLRATAKAEALFARCVQLAPKSCIAAECKGYAQLIH
jgi:hypothetical protein